MTVFVFPGQGSQKVGMGEGLFAEFPDLTAQADQILGYSISELCLKDPRGELGKTQFTQPALYVVNALTYQQKLKQGSKPKFVAGHSLGEYAALYAANVFDFATGLKLVKKRGELMALATGGGMAAVVGMTPEQIEQTLKNPALSGIDVANFNSVTQTVVSGLKEDVLNAQSAFEAGGAKMYIPLNVSGAFHSRYMKPAHDEFQEFLKEFTFNAPEITVIANVSAKPYTADDVKSNLAEQINHSVRWVETVQYLLQQGEEEFVEVGPGVVLAGLVARIKRNQ
jgi:malonyl CoA-acyl carrier protein transacylase